MKKYIKLLTLVTIFLFTIILTSCSENPTNEHLPDYCQTYTGFMSIASDDLYQLLDGVNRYNYLSVISEIELEFDLDDPNEEIDLSGLQCFQNLTTLTLSGRSFKDISPISALKNIQNISLINTSVVSIDSFKNLSKVNSLTISDSLLLQSVDGVEEMTKLTALDLSNNGIVNIDGLNQLVNLESLVLRNNEISFFPSINNLKNLTTLDVSYNDISRLGEDLSGLSNLETLNLSNNEICDLSSLDDLNNLEVLDLSFNNLDCNNTLESPDFTSLLNSTKLRELYLNDSNLSSISDLESKPLPLTVLHLENNNLVDISPIKNFSSLEELVLYNNKISVIGDLSGMSNITEIDLSYNEITDFTELLTIPDLEFVDLSYNYITFVPDLSNAWPGLREISLEYNDLTSTSGFNSHPRVEKINLLYNKLVTLEGISNMPYLDELILFENEEVIDEGRHWTEDTCRSEDWISNSNLCDVENRLTTIINSFNNIPNFPITISELFTLDFSFLTDVIDGKLDISGSFNDLQSIENISINGNIINSIDSNSLNNLNYVQTVTLSNVNFDHIDFIQNMPVVKEIDITASTISDINALNNLNGDFNALESINIFNTMITEDFDQILNGCSKLEVVSISLINGALEVNSSFNELPELTSLNLDFTATSIVNSFNNNDLLTELQVFYHALNGGNIEYSFNNNIDLASLVISDTYNSLPNDSYVLESFRNNESLSIISGLSGRNFTSIDNTSFEGTIRIEELDISNNKLSNIDFIDSITRLEVVNALDNNISDLELFNLDRTEGSLPVFNSLSVTLADNIVISNTFSNMADIDYLHVEGNNITSVENSFNNMNVTELVFDFNSIGNISTSFNDLVDVSTLSFSDIDDLVDTNITASFNNITEMPSGPLIITLRLSYVRLRFGITSIDTASFNNITEINVLDISDNRISNIDFINNITTLETLDASYNDINDFGLFGSVETIPNTLKSVDFSGNRAVISIDNLFNNLPLESIVFTDSSVTSIDQSFNTLDSIVEINFSGSILSEVSGSFSDITNEVSIDLTSNDITSITSSFVNLTNVLELNLDQNTITSISSSFNTLYSTSSLEEFNTLENATSINDSFNDVSFESEDYYQIMNPVLFSITNSFNNHESTLFDFNTIFLSSIDNSFSVGVESVVITNSNNLVIEDSFIDLEEFSLTVENGLSSIVNSLNNCTTCQVDVSGSGLSSISGTVFDHSTFASLELSNNELVSIVGNVFTNSTITDLDISNNNLEHVNFIEHITSLTTLNASGNNLNDFTVFNGDGTTLLTLEEVDFSNNQSSLLLSNTFNNLSIQIIDFSNSTITEITNSFSGLANITDLTFGNSSIGSISGSFNQFICTDGLKETDVLNTVSTISNSFNEVGCTINDVYVVVNSNLTTITDSFNDHLTPYSLDTNSLNSIVNSFNLVGDFVTIKSSDNLTLSNSFNDLESYDLVIEQGLSSISNSINNCNTCNVDLSGSGLTTLSNTVFDSGQFSSIDLSSNSISSIIGTIFNLSTIDLLDLSNNSITSITNGVLNNATVTDLNLSNNQLSSLSNTAFNTSTVTNIDISNNYLTSLDFTMISSLETVDLEFNRLSTFENIVDLPNVTSLIIGNQFLSDGITPSITTLVGFNNLPNLTSIDVSGLTVTYIDGFKNTGLTSFELSSANNNVLNNFTSISSTSFTDTDLTSLTLYDIVLDDVTFLSNIATLDHLELNVNVSDYSFLEATSLVTGLQSLNLHVATDYNDFTVLNTYSALNTLTLSSDYDLISIHNLDMVYVSELNIDFSNVTEINNSFNAKWKSGLVTNFDFYKVTTISNSFNNDFSHIDDIGLEPTVLSNISNSFDALTTQVFSIIGTTTIVDSFNNITTIEITNNGETSPNYDALSFDQMTSIVLSNPKYTDYGFMVSYSNLVDIEISSIDTNINNLSNSNITNFTINDIVSSSYIIDVLLNSNSVCKFNGISVNSLVINSNCSTYDLGVENSTVTITTTIPNMTIKGSAATIVSTNNSIETVSLQNTTLDLLSIESTSLQSIDLTSSQVLQVVANTNETSFTLLGSNVVDLALTANNATIIDVEVSDQFNLSSSVTSLSAQVDAINLDIRNTSLEELLITSGEIDWLDLDTMVLSNVDVDALVNNEVTITTGDLTPSIVFSNINDGLNINASNATEVSFGSNSDVVINSGQPNVTVKALTTIGNVSVTSNLLDVLTVEGNITILTVTGDQVHTINNTSELSSIGMIDVNTNVTSFTLGHGAISNTISSPLLELVDYTNSTSDLTVITQSSNIQFDVDVDELNIDSFDLTNIVFTEVSRVTSLLYNSSIIEYLDLSNLVLNSFSLDTDASSLEYYASSVSNTVITGDNLSTITAYSPNHNIEIHSLDIGAMIIDIKGDVVRVTSNNDTITMLQSTDVNEMILDYANASSINATSASIGSLLFLDTDTSITIEGSNISSIEFPTSSNHDITNATFDVNADCSITLDVDSINIAVNTTTESIDITNTGYISIVSDTLKSINSTTNLTVELDYEGINGMLNTTVDAVQFTINSSSLHTLDVENSDITDLVLNVDLLTEYSMTNSTIVKSTVNTSNTQFTVNDCIQHNITGDALNSVTNNAVCSSVYSVNVISDSSTSLTTAGNFSNLYIDYALLETYDVGESIVDHLIMETEQLSTFSDNSNVNTTLEINTSKSLLNASINLDAVINTSVSGTLSISESNVNTKEIRVTTNAGTVILDTANKQYILTGSNINNISGEVDTLIYGSDIDLDSMLMIINLTANELSLNYDTSISSMIIFNGTNTIGTVNLDLGNIVSITTNDAVINNFNYTNTSNGDVAIDTNSTNLDIACDFAVSTANITLSANSSITNSCKNLKVSSSVPIDLTIDHGTTVYPLQTLEIDNGGVVNLNYDATSDAYDYVITTDELYVNYLGGINVNQIADFGLKGAVRLLEFNKILVGDLDYLDNDFVITEELVFIDSGLSNLDQVYGSVLASVDVIRIDSLSTDDTSLDNVKTKLSGTGVTLDSNIMVSMYYDMYYDDHITVLTAYEEVNHNRFNSIYDPLVINAENVFKNNPYIDYDVLQSMIDLEIANQSYSSANAYYQLYYEGLGYETYLEYEEAVGVTEAEAVLASIEASLLHADLVIDSEAIQLQVETDIIADAIDLTNTDLLSIDFIVE